MILKSLQILSFLSFLAGVLPAVAGVAEAATDQGCPSAADLFGAVLVGHGDPVPSFHAVRTKALQPMADARGDAEAVRDDAEHMATLAASHVAYGLFHEAHGLRSRMGPPCRDASWLLGASLIATGSDAAVERLKAEAEDGDGSAALWLMLGSSTRFKGAFDRGDFLAATAHLDDLPEPLLLAGRLHVAFMALKAGFTMLAERLMAGDGQINGTSVPLAGSFPLLGLQSFIHGALAEKDGSIELAADHFQHAIEQGGRPGIEGALRLLNLQWQGEPARLSQTIRALEDLRWAWRGDPIEERILLTLIRAYSLGGHPLIAASLATVLVDRHGDGSVHPDEVFEEIVRTKLARPTRSSVEALLRFEVLSRYARRVLSAEQSLGGAEQTLRSLSEDYHLPTTLVSPRSGNEPVRLPMLGLKGQEPAHPMPSRVAVANMSSDDTDGPTVSPFLAALTSHPIGMPVDDALSRRQREILNLLSPSASMADPLSEDVGPFTRIKEILQNSADLETLVQTYLVTVLTDGDGPAEGATR